MILKANYERHADEFSVQDVERVKLEAALEEKKAKEEKKEKEKKASKSGLLLKDANANQVLVKSKDGGKKKKNRKMSKKNTVHVQRTSKGVSGNNTVKKMVVKSKQHDKENKAAVVTLKLQELNKELENTLPGLKDAFWTFEDDDYMFIPDQIMSA